MMSWSIVITAILKVLLMVDGIGRLSVVLIVVHILWAITMIVVVVSHTWLVVEHVTLFNVVSSCSS